MTRRTKRHIYIDAILIVITITFFTSHKWGMSKKEYNNITIYYHCETIKSDTILDNLFKTISDILKNKGLSLPNSNQSIYLCKSDLEFKIKSITLKNGVIGKTNYLLKRLYIKSVDFEHEIIPPQDSALNSRSITNIITHELTHSYQFEKLGLVSYRTAPSWKIEGMAEWVSNSSSAKTGDALPLYVKGESYDNTINCDKELWEKTFLYFVSRVRADYLLSYKQITEDVFWNTKYDTDELDKEIRGAIIHGNYIFDNFVFQDTLTNE